MLDKRVFELGICMRSVLRTCSLHAHASHGAAHITYNLLTCMHDVPLTREHGARETNAMHIYMETQTSAPPQNNTRRTADEQNLPNGCILAGQANEL